MHARPAGGWCCRAGRRWRICLGSFDEKLPLFGEASEFIEQRAFPWSMAVAVPAAGVGEPAVACPARWSALLVQELAISILHRR